MTVRKVRSVAAGTLGADLSERLLLETGFGIASAAAHLRDALTRMRFWSRGQNRFLANEGTSQIAVDEVTRALELLDVLSKQETSGGEGGNG